MGLNETIPNFRRDLFLLFFLSFGSNTKELKLSIKKEKYLDKQGKNLLQ